MKALTFRERDTARIGLGSDLTEAEAESIGRIADRLPSGALSWGHRTLRFGPFCGVIQTPQIALELLPKVERGPQASEDMRSMLVAMLARAGELGAKRVGQAALGQQSSHLLDIFIEDFCNQLKEALRSGAITRYSEKTESLNAIRGRLELTDHLRTNALDRSRLLCRFDERSIDNAYNRALKAVLRMLRGLALSARTRVIVASFLHRFEDVADVRRRPRLGCAPARPHDQALASRFPQCLAAAHRTIPRCPNRRRTRLRAAFQHGAALRNGPRAPHSTGMPDASRTQVVRRAPGPSNKSRHVRISTSTRHLNHAQRRRRSDPRCKMEAPRERQAKLRRRKRRCISNERLCRPLPL